MLVIPIDRFGHVIGADPPPEDEGETSKKVVTPWKTDGPVTVADLIAALSLVPLTARVVVFADNGDGTTTEQVPIGQVDTYEYGAEVGIWLERYEH